MGDGTDAVRSCQVARYAAVLACVGLAFDLATGPLPQPHPIEIAAIAVTAGVFVVLSSRRVPKTMWIGIVMFFVVNLAVIAALWLRTERIATSGVHWVPFRQYHLGTLAVAALAPPRLWVGLSNIAAFGGAAMIQLATFAPQVRASLPYGEPWATLAFGGFAVALLVFRIRANRIEREAARMHERMVALEELSRTMLAIRDLANTPLQTLELGVGLLRLDAPNSTIADRIERAVARLREIDRIATAHERERPSAPYLRP